MNSRRKLFLSWMAVREALSKGDVCEADLRDCLFATSVGELILGATFDMHIFVRLFPHLLQAAQEGRLAYYDKIEKVNGTTFEQVNDLLSRNGVTLLSGRPTGPLDHLRDNQDVPHVQDLSLSVLWCGQPSADEMQTARRTRDDEIFALVVRGEKPNFPFANWMSDIKLALAAQG